MKLKLPSIAYYINTETLVLSFNCFLSSFLKLIRWILQYLTVSSTVKYCSIHRISVRKDDKKQLKLKTKVSVLM